MSSFSSITTKRSSSVLERMNRKYTSEEYYDRILLLRKYFENPAFTTDVIVGFPGETDKEFEETLDFIKKVDFSYIHIFKYSRREQTRAYDMPNQIPDSIKKYRSDILKEAVEEMSERYKEGFIGKEQKILVEETIVYEGNEYQVGHNERYLKLAIESCQDLNNQIIKVRVVEKLNDEILFCKIIN